MGGGAVTATGAGRVVSAAVVVYETVSDDPKQADTTITIPPTDFGRVTANGRARSILLSHDQAEEDQSNYSQGHTTSWLCACRRRYARAWLESRLDGLADRDPFSRRAHHDFLELHELAAEQPLISLDSRRSRICACRNSDRHPLALNSRAGFPQALRRSNHSGVVIHRVTHRL